MKNSSNPPKIIRAAEVTSETLYDFELSNLKSSQAAPPRAKAKTKQPEQPQLTAAMLDKIQQDAHQEGYEAGRKEGFEFGHKEALESYRKKYDAQLSDLDMILKSFSQPFEKLDDQVENEIVELVVSMVKQLVRREVRMDPSHIVGVVREALAILPVAARDISVVLNPADAEIVRQAYDLAEREENWKIVEEPTLDRGGCKILAAQSSVDATLESRLDAMIAPLLDDERRQESAEAAASSVDSDKHG